MEGIHRQKALLPQQRATDNLLNEIPVKTVKSAGGGSKSPTEKKFKTKSLQKSPTSPTTDYHHSSERLKVLTSPAQIRRLLLHKIL